MYGVKGASFAGFRQSAEFPQHQRDAAQKAGEVSQKFWRDKTIRELVEGTRKAKIWRDKSTSKDRSNATYLYLDKAKLRFDPALDQLPNDTEVVLSVELNPNTRAPGCGLVPSYVPEPKLHRLNMYMTVEGKAPVKLPPRTYPQLKTQRNLEAVCVT